MGLSIFLFLLIGLLVIAVASLFFTNFNLKQTNIDLQNSTDIAPGIELILNKHILATSGVLISLVDTSYVFTAANQKYFSVFNKNRDNVVGQHFEKLHGKEVFLNTVKPYLERCFKGEKIHTQHMIDIPGKGLRYVDAEYSPYKKPNQEVSGAIICLRDITETRQKAEDLSAAFRIHQTTITLSSLKTGKYLVVNSEFTTLTGYSTEEALGVTPEELKLRLNDKEHKDYCDQLARNKRINEHEIVIRTKSGEFRDVRTSAEIIEINGEDFILDVSHDITEQKKLIESLYISDEQFKNLFEHAPIGMMLTDSAGELIKINRAMCDISGLQMEELQGQYYVDLFHSKDKEMIEINLQKIIDGDSSHIQIEARSRYMIDDYFWSSIDISAIRNADNNLQNMVIQQQDITTRKQTEEALEDVAYGLSRASGKSFFNSLAQHIASSLGIDFVSIAEIDEKNTTCKLATVAVYGHGQILEPLEYVVAGTPCEKVIQRGSKTYSDSLQKIFPNSPLFMKLEAEAYIGVVLKNSEGQPIGIISAIHTSKIKNAEMTESLLRIFSSRAGAELERMAAEQELRRYEKIVSASSDFMAFVDRDYTYCAVNQSYLDVFETTRSEMIGNNVSNVLEGEYFENKVKARFNRCFEGEHVHAHNWVNLPSKGRRYLDIRYNPYFERPDLINGAVVCIRDMTEFFEISEKLAYQASHDTLTNLLNRSEFERRLFTLLKNAKSDNSQHALCYMDLDRFKIVNDTCGHSAGDELLRQLGDLLGEHMRSRDSLARMGGDEFAILIEHCDPDQAYNVANKFRELVQEFTFVWEARNFNIGASIGLVLINQMSGDMNEVLKFADIACYAAKDAGRNRIHVFEHDPEDLTRLNEEMEWVTPVEQALINGDFFIYAQPIIPVKNKSSDKKSYELLIRVEVDDELISPDTFLSAIERYGLSSKLDISVVNRIFDILKDKDMDAVNFFSINLSGNSLNCEEVLEFILKKLDSSGINPEKICFEITESIAIANLSYAKRFMSCLKQRGCLFALDDFGSGFSSFAYLKNLQVDFLKIDGMFIQDITDDPIDLAMVKSINEIGQILGIKTIAEFVDSESTMRLLQEIGVDGAQGSYLGMPKNIDDIKQF